MTLADRFAEAMGVSTDPEALFPDQLAAACVALLPVDGAGLTVTHSSDRRLPIGSSDPVSAAAERLQFTLGEGPCLTAQHTGQLIRASAEDLLQRWPVYAVELTARTPFRSVVALPLPGLQVTVELYTHTEHPAPGLSGTDLTELTAVLATLFVTGLTEADDEHLGLGAWRWAPPASSRMTIWQAIGRLASTAEVSNTEALSLLRAQAFGAGQDLEDTARDVLGGLAPHPDGEWGPEGPVTTVVDSRARFRHRMRTVVDHVGAEQVDGRPVVTALPRGRHRDHALLCGACDAILAWGYEPGPLPAPAPVLRCPRCGSLNDPTHGTDLPGQ